MDMFTGRSGPTASSDYPLLMFVISVLCTVGLLGAVFPLFETIFSYLLILAIAGSVVYMIAHWVWDEYKLNQEIKKEIEVSK